MIKLNISNKLIITLKLKFIKRLVKLIIIKLLNKEKNKIR